MLILPLFISNVVIEQLAGLKLTTLLLFNAQPIIELMTT
ncbi:uncharacterized protein METZ01_LOCUS144501 [marine metagenome]|uniref:Uncharacterized protein n=1 Tax=marine metagenome TaxID=408172 RepID=A0A381ZS71_9ZZZZ